MRSLFRKISNRLLRTASLTWKPYSRLIFAGDNAGWVLDWEMREISNIVRRLGIRLLDPGWRDAAVHQSVFLADQFFLLNDQWLAMHHRIGFSYFHGMPNTGEALFDQIYMALRKNHERISRIQVSHIEMRNVILQTGIEPAKVHLIPIGVNLGYFPIQNDVTKIYAREKFGIPRSAFVIGSFQKDGVGWGEGLEPKLVKGPDVFLSVVEKLKTQIPDLYILLSGPARGYIKAGLERLHVPYSHFYLDSYPQVGQLFQALNLYLVTARQEGGPKAILESMASGVPIISTRVGQATDLIQHGQNGWLASVGDSESIANWALHVRNLNDAARTSILLHGRATAEANCYAAQIPLWEKFMKGFVE